MKFFMDFEATRFSNRIISIGCVAENGNTFSTLVHPGKKKVDKFITELTGITNEMLDGAPSADMAFIMFYDFMVANFDGEMPEYYVYGNCDSSFLLATARKMTNPLAITFAQALAGNLIDYASTVKQFFVAKNDLALRKVYMLVQDEKDLVQKHDALEDARMLCAVVEHLYEKCKPEDKDTIMSMPSQPKPFPRGSKVDPRFIEWEKQSKWEAKTGANENTWVIKCVDQHTNNVMYFPDWNTAALWIVKYIARNVSPKKEDQMNKIISAIKSAPQTGKCRYNCYWTYNPEGAIAMVAKEDKAE